MVLKSQPQIWKRRIFVGSRECMAQRTDVGRISFFLSFSFPFWALERVPNATLEAEPKPDQAKGGVWGSRGTRRVQGVHPKDHGTPLWSRLEPHGKVWGNCGTVGRCSSGRVVELLPCLLPL
jgi:hypothetical protein